MNYEKKCFALHRRFNDDGYATRTTIEQVADCFIDNIFDILLFSLLLCIDAR